eukprot:548433-Rhodomonas_salina.2
MERGLWSKLLEPELGTFPVRPAAGCIHMSSAAATRQRDGSGRILLPHIGRKFVLGASRFIFRDPSVFSQHASLARPQRANCWVGRTADEPGLWADTHDRISGQLGAGKLRAKTLMSRNVVGKAVHQQRTPPLPVPHGQALPIGCARGCRFDGGARQIGVT